MRNCFVRRAGTLSRVSLVLRLSLDVTGTAPPFTQKGEQASSSVNRRGLSVTQSQQDQQHSNNAERRSRPVFDSPGLMTNQEHEDKHNTRSSAALQQVVLACRVRLRAKLNKLKAQREEHRDGWATAIPEEYKTACKDDTPDRVDTLPIVERRLERFEEESEVVNATEALFDVRAIMVQ